MGFLSRSPFLAPTPSPPLPLNMQFSRGTCVRPSKYTHQSCGATLLDRVWIIVQGLTSKVESRFWTSPNFFCRSRLFPFFFNLPTICLVKTCVAHGRLTLEDLTNEPGVDLMTLDRDTVTLTLMVQQTYEVDDLGRVWKQRDALNRTWVMDYDIHGNVIQVTDPKSQVTTMSYGYGVQLISRSGIGLSVSYTRNTLGQVIQANSNAVTYDYTYDIAHRVATIRDSRGPQTLTYDYTTGGRLTTRKESHLGAEVSRTDYVYDAVGRLSAMWAGHGEVLTFVYDAGGRLSEQWLPNGVNAHYSYNEDNTLQHLEHRTIGGTLLAEHEYTYDAVGNRDTYTDTDPSCSMVTTATYNYDELNRLIQVITDEDTGSQINSTTESYAYDILGNRTTQTKNGVTKVYAYDVANQLTAIHQDDLQGQVLTSFAYDLNGNLQSKSGTSGTLNMTYDAWDRMTQAQKTWSLPEQYAYDDVGRRIRKTIGATTKDYLYDGLDIIAEYTTTNWATPQVQYTHGPGIDAPIIRASGGTSSYYHQDGLGSVVAVTDESGEATGTVRYDAWGAVSRQTGGIPQYGYTGREPDNTGLVYYRARYYDPDTGRFTQPDPIGLSGGTNLYAYAGGDPVNLVDPMGTTPNSVKNFLTQTNSPIASLYAPISVVSNNNLSASSSSNNTSGFETFTKVVEIAAPVLQKLPGGYTKGASLLLKAATKVDKIIKVLKGAGQAVKSGYNSLLKAVGLAPKSAFEIAKQGGKHSGFLKNYANRPPQQIRSGISSLEKQIAVHQAKIQNPSKLVKGFDKLDPRKQQHLINEKWPSDIARQREQAEILRGLLNP